MQFRRVEQQQSQRERAGHDHEQCGQDAAGAAGIEARESETAGDGVAIDDAADQVARNDEEDIDPGVARAKRPQPGMEQHDGDNGNGAQSVDIRTVAHGGEVIVEPSNSRLLNHASASIIEYLNSVTKTLVPRQQANAGDPGQLAARGGNARHDKVPGPC